MTHATPLWAPDPERRSNGEAFRRWLADQDRAVVGEAYEDLWRWSVDHLSDFWQAVWDCCGVRSSTDYRAVLADRSMPGAR